MFVGELLHDRIIGALEICCRRGEMLLIQNKRVNWETHQIRAGGRATADRCGAAMKSCERDWK